MHTSTTEPHWSRHLKPDAKDELSAWNKKDAWYQIQDMLKARPVGDRFRESASSEEAIDKLWNDPTDEGRVILGQELARSIWNWMTPNPADLPPPGLARKLFSFRGLQQGEMVNMALDVIAVAAYVHTCPSEDVKKPSVTLLLPANHGRYAPLVSFKLISAPKLGIETPSRDVLECAAATGFQEVTRDEDRAAIRLFNTIAPKVELVGGPTAKNLKLLRTEVEKHRLVMRWVVLNRKRVADVIAGDLAEELEPVTSRALLLQGIYATWFGAFITAGGGLGLQEVVAPNTAYAVTDHEYLGYSGQRVQLFAEPFHTTDETRKRVMSNEEFSAYLAQTDNRRPPLIDGQKTAMLFHRMETHAYAPIDAYGYAFCEIIEMGVSTHKAVACGVFL